MLRLIEIRPTNKHRNLNKALTHAQHYASKAEPKNSGDREPRKLSNVSQSVFKMELSRKEHLLFFLLFSILFNLCNCTDKTQEKLDEEGKKRGREGKCNLIIYKIYLL